MSVLYVVAPLIGGALAWLSVKEYRNYKNKPRRCTDPACEYKPIKIQKICKMYPVPDARNPDSDKGNKKLGKKYDFYVLYKCLHCGSVRLGRSWTEYFSPAKIAWRRKHEPDVFVHDSKLFEEAGLSDPTIPRHALPEVQVHTTVHKDPFHIMGK